MAAIIRVSRIMEALTLYENSVDSNYARLARTMASAKAAYHILDGLKLSTIFTVDYSLNKDFFFYSPDGKDGEATQDPDR